MQPSKPKGKESPDSFFIANNLLNSIISTVTSEGNTEKSTKPKDFLFKNLLEVNKQKIIKDFKFIQRSTKKEYHLLHLQVHHQFLGNFCGYHASFNLIESLNLLKSRQLNSFYTLDQPQKFWKYVFETHDFLWKYGVKKGLSAKWPFDYYNTHFGDFERTFLKICVAYNPTFIDAFKSDSNFEIKFLNINAQFFNLINEEWEFEQAQKEMDEFIKFSKKNQHKVLAFMLGICNHWVSLLVHKFNSDIEFIFFDSRNIDYLSWSESQIIEGVNERAQGRILEGRVPYTNFKITIEQQAIRDMQRVLDLLVNCVLGNTSLLKYNNDRRLDILYTSIQSEVPYINEDFNNMNYETLFSVGNKNLVQILESLNNWILNYFSTMKKFFTTFHDKNDLDEEYNLKLLKFLDYFRHLYKFWKLNEQKLDPKKFTKLPYIFKPLKISPLFDYSNL